MRKAVALAALVLAGCASDDSPISPHQRYVPSRESGYYDFPGGVSNVPSRIDPATMMMMYQMVTPPLRQPARQGVTCLHSRTLTQCY